MNKIFTTLAAAAFCAVLSAEIVKNPDPNTLWIENGKDVKTAAKHGDLIWGLGGKATITSLDKGFKISGPGNLGIYVPVSNQYPWLCYEIKNVERITSGYHAFSMNPALDIGVFSVVTKIPKGTYCIALGSSSKLKEKPRWNYMRLDIHNANVALNYVGMFKEPPCALSLGKELIKKGTDVKIEIKTKEPAEMVQLKFYKAYTMPAIQVIPNAKRYLAKPVDGTDNKEWTFSFPYNGFKGIDGKIGTVVIEAVVETKDDVHSYFFFNQVPFEK